MGVRYYCKNEKRKNLVRDHISLNGIDYIEVSSDQKTLEVHFIKPLQKPLAENNVLVVGGVRIREIKAISVEPLREDRKVLKAHLDKTGDFSTYRLCLVESQATSKPPENFDKKLSESEFSFKVECPSEFDCRSTMEEHLPRLKEPRIDYLARDYTSLRNLILDRLSTTIPNWKERNPADLGMVLVELLAYAGDYLSYYQDAVATEAYLATARKRVSVRRHARLLDYLMHDGCNSRAWVCFEVSDKIYLKKSTRLMTSCPGEIELDEDRLENLVGTYHPDIFESMHDATLYPAHNKIPFYTWGDDSCILPKGATRATLCDDDPLHPLLLQPGDVLIFEELRGPNTGEEADADPAHRHAVRLTKVDPEARIDREDSQKRIPGSDIRDPLTDQKIVEIEWHPEDALPFSLCASASLAHGNVLLADHGCTYEDELFPAAVSEKGRYRPVLRRKDISFGVPYDHEEGKKTSASSIIRQDPRGALPSVWLVEDVEDAEVEDADVWIARRDLLNSDRFALEFVVEAEDDGIAHLRFGDDILGKKPIPGSEFKAFYRAGNGLDGNVGAEAIAHVALLGQRCSSIIDRVWNPLPAQGGTDPEPTEDVRLYAPQAFRRQERAVTESDYEEVAQRHPDVQKAMASLRWTGSWYTMFITVDRRGGREVDSKFEREILDFFEQFRLAGHDIEIEGPRFVSLDIAFRVRIAPDRLRGDVLQMLLATFSNQSLPDGRRGIFHPDNFTFGQAVYLSRLVAAAMQVPGVIWIEAVRFCRWGQPDGSELEEGMISFERLEIARLDNDPNFPENGKIEFIMEGGL